MEQGVNIMSVDDLRQKLKPEYRLEVSSLKYWVKELVTMLKTAFKNNLTDSPME